MGFADPHAIESGLLHVLLHVVAGRPCPRLAAQVHYLNTAAERERIHDLKSWLFLEGAERHPDRCRRLLPDATTCASLGIDPYDTATILWLRGEPHDGAHCFKRPCTLDYTTLITKEPTYANA